MYVSRDVDLDCFREDKNSESEYIKLLFGIKLKFGIYLLQVDGKSNSKIQSLFIENFPVLCAHFTQDGEQIVIGSKHKSFKYFDMISGKVINVPMKGRIFSEFFWILFSFGKVHNLIIIGFFKAHFYFFH
jgi:hypothetical protein